MYMPTWPAANAWLIVPQSNRKFDPIELSSQRSRLEVLESGDGAGVVDRDVDDVVGHFLEAATEGVAERRQHPAAGVVLRHLGEAGLAGGLGDRRGRASRTSAHVVGGASGSRPASSNSARL